jgi:hypothetical protein
MKKIITLLFCLGTLSTVFAQKYPDNSRRDNQRNVYANDKNNDRRYKDSYAFSTRERNEQIAMVYREYNARIDEVKHKGYLKNKDKRRLIADLEVERSARIRSINARFADGRNRHNDNYVYNNNRH